MLKQHKYLILLLGWIALVSYLSLRTMEGTPNIEIPNFDKIVHAVFHFIHTVLWYLFINFELKNKYIRHSLRLAMVIDIVYGCLIEVLQGILTDDRHADILDIAANVFGTILAAIVVKVIIKKTQVTKGFFN